MKRLVFVFATAIFAACGGSKAPPPTAPEPAAPAAEKPAEPAEPAKPVETTPPTPPTAPATPVAPAKPAGPDKAQLAAAETSAYEKAKPVFEKYCASCHTKGGKKANAKKLGHLDMTNYPFGGEHTKSVGNEIRKVLGIDGDKPTMPFDKKGAVQGDDLALIKAWTEAWRASGAAGNHPAEPADKDDD